MNAQTTSPESILNTDVLISHGWHGHILNIEEMQESGGTVILTKPYSEEAVADLVSTCGFKDETGEYDEFGYGQIAAFVLPNGRVRFSVYNSDETALRFAAAFIAMQFVPFVPARVSTGALREEGIEVGHEQVSVMAKSLDSYNVIRALAIQEARARVSAV